MLNTVGGLGPGVLSVATLFTAGPAQTQKPNILVIMGDDIGRENLGSYHQGLMPNANLRTAMSG
jgi:hypothetical protein